MGEALRRCLLLSLLGALFCPMALTGQPTGRQPLVLLGPDDGLPPGTINAVTQDREGFLWLGTENGVVRYAGPSFRRWTAADGLPASYINRLAADPEGGVWVGTLTGLLHGARGRFQAVPLGEEAGSINGLCVDEAGLLWVVMRRRAYRQVSGLDFREIPLEEGEEPGNVSFGARSRQVYLSGTRGIRVYREGRLVRVWRPADGVPAAGVNVAVEDGEGILWAGLDRVLCALPPGCSRFRDESSLLPGPLSPNSTPFVDEDGSVWLPTQNGALRLRGGVVGVLDHARGLPYKWVRTVFRDREGTLWVVGPALARLQGRGRLWNFSLSDAPFGEVVWKVILDRKRGLPLVGSDDGAAWITPEGLERIPGSRGIRIKDLLTDRAGTLWMVSSIGPTLWLGEGASEAREAPLGDLGRGINTLLEDAGGRIWLGHGREGLLLWTPEQQRLRRVLRPEASGLRALGISGLREDGRGRLWVASTDGLYIGSGRGPWLRFGAGDGLCADYIRGLTLMEDGTAWIFYQESHGLTHIRLVDGRLEILGGYGHRDGLSSDAVYACEADSRRRLWISTDRGLNRMDPHLHLGREEGMVSEDCAIGALLVDGPMVWVGTASGLVRYEDRDEPVPPPPPPARILSVRYGDLLIEQPFGPLPPLSAGEASVQFHFALPSYRDPRALRYRMRLLGLEQRWRDSPGTNVLFPVLEGGTYRFEVQGAVGRGPFGPSAVFSFSVRPRWWRSWWGVTLLLLAGLGLLSFFVRWRLGALARSKAELELLVARRTHELQERNEELSGALGNVRQLSGLLPICAQCKKIRDDQGYWNQLETYISAHSEADFSHGLCPDCARTLYPQYFVAEGSKGVAEEN